MTDSPDFVLHQRLESVEMRLESVEADLGPMRGFAAVVDLDKAAWNKSKGKDRPSQPNINHRLLQLLENAIEEVRAGRIIGGSVLLVDGNNQVGHFTSVGKFHCYLPMISGAGVLQHDLIMWMKETQQQNANKKRSVARSPQLRD
jgi:hypothetical protein